MLQTIFCKHYRAPAEHKTCEAGVEYTKLRNLGLSIGQWPCFCKPGKEPPSGCQLATFPTAEEIAAEKEEVCARVENIGKARKAIVDYLGPWKKGKPAAGGHIDCPVCGGVGTLRFSRAGYNGHIHARCDSTGCVTWME